LSDRLLAVRRARPRGTVAKKGAAPSTRTQPVRVKKEPITPPKKASKRGFEEIVDMSDDENDVEEEEQDPPTAGRRAASSSSSVPVVEIPRKTRQSSLPSKTAKKVRLETTPQQEFHDILQAQFQAISEAFHVISVTMGKVMEQ
jgi:hypothetical protein